MYNKLFSKIVHSSIWLEDNPTRIVWITLLAVMDRNGFCDFACPESVARVAGVTAEEGVRAMEILMSPDTRNPGQENDGRRIDKVDGGYLVINKPKYDVIFRKEIIRQQTAVRVARHRKKRFGKQDTNNDVVPEAKQHSVEVTIPTKEEWLGICRLQALPDWRGEEEYVRQMARDTPWRGVNLAGHAARVRTWWQADGCPETAEKARGRRNGVSGVLIAAKELRVQKALEFEGERDPEARKQLRAEIVALDEQIKCANEELVKQNGSTKGRS